MSSDAIGEYYCLCKLLLEKKEAYLANGLTQKGWDIAVLENEKTIRVQVKCIDWKSSGSAAVKGTFYKKEFDYLVIVLLNYKKIDFTSFVIPYEKLKEKRESDKNTLIDKSGNIYYSARKEKRNGKGFEKQAIAISTIKKDAIREKFEIYHSKFNTIKHTSA